MGSAPGPPGNDIAGQAVEKTSWDVILKPGSVCRAEESAFVSIRREKSRFFTSLRMTSSRHFSRPAPRRGICRYPAMILPFRSASVRGADFGADCAKDATENSNSPGSRIARECGRDVALNIVIIRVIICAFIWPPRADDIQLGTGPLMNCEYLADGSRDRWIPSVSPYHTLLFYSSLQHSGPKRG